MSQNDKVMLKLGLAQKAGQLVSGSFAVEKAVKSGTAYFVILAVDASSNTKKKIKNMTKFYKVPLCEYGDKDGLGRSIGKEYRSVAALTDPNFADMVKKQLADMENN